MKYIKILLIVLLFTLTSCGENVKNSTEDINKTEDIKKAVENQVEKKATWEAQETQTKILKPILTEAWAIIISEDENFMINIPLEAFENPLELSVQENLFIWDDSEYKTYKLISEKEKNWIIPFQIIMKYDYNSEVGKIFENVNQEEWTKYTEDNITILKNKLDIPVLKDKETLRLSSFDLEFDWEYQLWLSESPSILSNSIWKLEIYKTYTIFPEEYDISSVFEIIKRYKPSKFEAWKTMNAVQLYLDENKKENILNNFGDYKAQFFWWINEEWEKIIYANYFCDDFENWKTELVEVEDGWECYFNLKINLDTEEVFDFRVNWNA